MILTTRCSVRDVRLPRLWHPLCLALWVPTRKRSSSERALLRKGGTMDARRKTVGTARTLPLGRAAGLGARGHGPLLLRAGRYRRGHERDLRLQCLRGGTEDGPPGREEGGEGTEPQARAGGQEDLDTRRQPGHHR